MSSLNRLVERGAAALEGATALDPVIVPVQSLARRLPAGRLKDLLSGVPAGHPLHPAIVAVPLGAFAGVSYLDLVGGDRVAARRLLLLGVAASVPAVVTGLSDWSDTEGSERRVGAVHAATNAAALGLYVSSWLARGSGDRRGRKRSLGALTVLSVGGWLGGHLAYALGVGVDTTAFLDPVVEWADACALTDLAEDKPLGAKLGDTPVVLALVGGVPRALFGRCTHRGAPLAEGRLVDGCVECPWHGSRFALTDGGVERGPATRPQPSFEVRVREGRVLVRRSESRALRVNSAR